MDLQLRPQDVGGGGRGAFEVALPLDGLASLGALEAEGNTGAKKGRDHAEGLSTSPQSRGLLHRALKEAAANFPAPLGAFG